MSNALIIRFKRGLEHIAEYDPDRAVVTINTDWWETLTPFQQSAVMQHEALHHDYLKR